MKFVSPKRIRALLADTLDGSFSVEPITSGLLNQNLLVTTPGARFVFKAYRNEVDRAKVEETHRMMAHVARWGIPVPLPIATYEVAGHAAALYPFVEGAHPPRYGLGVTRAAVLGETLGRVDAALDSFRPAGKKPSSIEIARWDHEAFEKEIADVRRSLRGKPRVVREDVERTLAAYETILPLGDWSKARFAKLPVRVCHGDYHMHNVLMKNGTVSAVLDWEKAGWNWRGFEVMRSTMFLCRRSSGTFCWDDVAAYLRGYAREERLTDAERALTFDCGFTKAFFSLWAMQRYVAGEARVRDNMLRRATFLPYLFKHRAEFSERIARLLRPSSSP